MTLLLYMALAQVSPGPWEEPLAPTLSAQWVTAAEELPAVRPSLLQSIGRGAFFFYKATMSHAKGDNCRFKPSCSLYGHQAIERLGLLPGLALFGARLMRGHINLDRFYAFDGTLILDPLDDTLAWLEPKEEIPTWQRLQLRSSQQSLHLKPPGHL